jgi:hypothetical protein
LAFDSGLADVAFPTRSVTTTLGLHTTVPVPPACVTFPEGAVSVIERTEPLNDIDELSNVRSLPV